MGKTLGTGAALLTRIGRRIRWEWDKAGIRRRLSAECRAGAPDPHGESYLIFSPEAAIVPHYVALCVAGRTLKELGHRVLVARCLELFPRCPVMDNFNYPDEVAPALREQTCYRCATEAEASHSVFGLPGVDLRTYWTSKQKECYETALSRIGENPWDFQYDGVYFGRLAAMNLALRKKVSNFQAVREDERAIWCQYIGNALVAYLALKELFAKTRVKAVLTYNDYAACLGARVAAERCGIRAFSLTHPSHKNIDRTTLWISPTVSAQTLYRLPGHWPAWRDIALAEGAVKTICEDLYFRFESRGSHNYSPARDLDRNTSLASLRLNPARKLLVAFTSSLDEVRSMEAVFSGLCIERAPFHDPFENQIEWLKTLVEQVESSEDLQLVVRVHPREGKNKREGRESEHLQWLRSEFADRAMKHCRFIWPTDAISSYDLAELADLALVSYSSIGLELARIGVPVVVATPQLAGVPEGDFFYCAKDKASFGRVVREALREEAASWERIRRAFRWYHLYTFAQGVDLSDVIDGSDAQSIPVFRLPRRAALIEAAIVHGRDTVALNLELQSKRAPAGSDREELCALRKHLQAFLVYLVGADAGTIPSVSADRRLTFQSAGKSQSRYSPLGARLARLLAQAESGRESYPASRPA